MHVMQQSSKAYDRSLGDWFVYIDKGMIKLPRFQRMEAWDRGRITSFLNTIISNLPMGVVLVLEVAGEEKFVSRYIETAEPESGEKVTQHLLDGQQRLTAFWRAMHNNYDYDTYFIYHPDFDPRDERLDDTVQVARQPRWFDKHGRQMPLWADDPVECLARGLLPLSLLRPGDITGELSAWLDKATQPWLPADDDPEALPKYRQYTQIRDTFKDELQVLRERVAHFNLPYLSLPANTDKDVALQVFINMNTNSKPLTLYDIIVAEVESVTGRSMHDLEAGLGDACPHAARYDELQDLILSTSALLQDKVPNARGMIEMNKQTLVGNWHHVERGLERMANFLASQGVYDELRLPTNIVLPVIAACYELIPDEGDFLGKAENLLQRYLWSAFFTDRYENSAATRSYADFRALKRVLQEPKYDLAALQGIPILDREQYPLASADELIYAGWPRNKGIEARAIMAVTTYFEARDFADNQPASYESLRRREYHHIFPDALLREAEISGSVALNCALITWKTNRNIGRKNPLDYLRERVEWADVETVRRRMRTHLIDYDLLAGKQYGDLSQSAERERLTADFNAFLRDRAERVLDAASALTEGDTPSLEALWADKTESAGV